MHRSVKIISVIVAACISLIYIGSFRVKAVSSAVLGLSGLIACIECLGSSIIGSSSQIAVNSNSGVSLDDFGLGTSGGSASLTSDQLMSYYLSSIDPSEVSGMSDQEALIYVTDPDRFDKYLSEYISSPVSIGVEYGCKSYLSEVHLAAEQGKVISDISGLVLSPSTFSDIVNSVSSDVIAEITGNEASVSFQNGIRNITIYRTSTFEIYSDLASQYSVRSVYRPRSISPPFDFLDSGNFFVLSNVSFGDTFYYVYVCGSCYVSPVSCTFDLVTDNYGNYYAICGPCTSMPYVYSHYRYSFSASYYSKAFSDPVGLFHRFSISDYFPTDALFEFSNLDDAQRFADALGTFTEDNYNPDDDVYSGDDVISAELPGTVPEAVADYYGGEKDIVVSPGAVKADDGTTTYDPSITIDGTDVKDTANDDEKFKEWQNQRGFTMGLEPKFRIYDQIKNLLENLFNYDDVNTPPSFKFYWDSDGDGTSETYNVLDLSVLETTLTNDNMEDKSWWGSSIKVIDVIRYIIAAILYGLFVMRLIKRLPTFYGSGPWGTV